ncbi:hypothetical protein ABZ897_17505 [Nonomuraea sp. NPDC046802]|uniref:hypothetical protein n=1 Tax=Nonomuraea sp. NPDC046802 TaxID=3154919 RepID=UPI0033E69C1C
MNVEAMKLTGGTDRVRVEALYVRVSDSSKQETALRAQDEVLRATSTGDSRTARPVCVKTGRA